MHKHKTDEDTKGLNQKTTQEKSSRWLTILIDLQSQLNFRFKSLGIFSNKQLISFKQSVRISGITSKKKLNHKKSFCIFCHTNFSTNFFLLHRPILFLCIKQPHILFFIICLAYTFSMLDCWNTSNNLQIGALL